MRSPYLGDLAQTFQLQRHNVTLKTERNQLSQEMTTGRKADVSKAVKGDFSALGSIEHGLQQLSAWKVSNSEAALQAGTLQTALESVQSHVQGFGATLLSNAATANVTLVSRSANEAKAKLESVMGALNARVADRYLLSGVATDTPPLASSSELVSALMTEITGETTVSGIVSAVDAWFAAPRGGGGFLDTVYQGSDTPLAPFALGEGETAQMSATAADPALRDVMRGLALGALVANGALAGNNEARAALMREAGAGLLAADDHLTGLRSEVGSVERRIEELAARNAAETSALTLAKSGIVSADPYEAASGLSAAEGRLQVLYTITARLSRLSLAEYLR